MTDNPELGSWVFRPPSLGQQLRDLFTALMASAGRKRLIFIAVGLVVVIGATVVGQLRLNVWNKDFFDAVEQRNFGTFVVQLGVFAAIAVSLLVLNVSQIWLDQTAKVELRKWLSRDLIAQWMRPKRAFFIARAGAIGVNPDQRIHEDARRLTELSAALSIGFFQSSLLFLSFVGVLWVLSRGFVIDAFGHSFAIPGFMVWAAILYAASGSFFTWLVSRPLIRLEVDRYAREANLRFALVRVSESIDGIALAAGEQEEQRHIEQALNRVIAVMRRIVRGVAQLTWVTAGYGWFATVAPILIAAPGYFSGQLSFGELMMTVGAFNQVQQSLRWFVDNARDIADWRATLQRVMGFHFALRAMDRLEQSRSRIEIVPDAAELRFDNVVVEMEDRAVTLDKDVVEVKPGERVLFIGQPGAGKSMFFRAIAGLWPWGSGTLHVPERADTMFFPQRSYITYGTLREALAYPADPQNFAEAELVSALERTNLTSFISSLDRKARWDREMTQDEKLRLCFARMLVHKPRWVIDDDAICHLTEINRKIMFSIFEKELSQTSVVSITSLDVQDRFYSRVLHLVGSPAQASSVPAATSALLTSSGAAPAGREDKYEGEGDHTPK